MKQHREAVLTFGNLKRQQKLVSQKILHISLLTNEPSCQCMYRLPVDVCFFLQQSSYSSLVVGFNQVIWLELTSGWAVYVLYCVRHPAGRPLVFLPGGRMDGVFPPQRSLILG